MLNLGLLYTSKYTKNIDFAKVIEGISGGELGFKLIYDLTKMVHKSKEKVAKSQLLSSSQLLANIAISKV